MQPRIVLLGHHNLSPRLSWSCVSKVTRGEATQGLPRKVNLLAHHALLATALARAKVVTAEHVQAALAEVS